MILTEHRWKCDYCGIVSPAMTNPKEQPRGWLTTRLTDGISRKRAAVNHFCCADHMQRFLHPGTEG